MKLRTLILTAPILVFQASLADFARADAAEPEASSQSSDLLEIVVTARRRSENLQDVPEAIEAFSEQTLRERAVYNSFDLNSAVPGLTVNAGNGNAGEADFAIRGRGLNYGASAGSVETYFADVPLSSPFQMPSLALQYFDLQSLQVLKGPQGTLFGRSTTGGAVLLVPQAPTNELGGYVRLQGGTFGDFQAEGAINIPIVADKVELRLAGFDWQRQGYSKTLGGNTDVFGQVLPSQKYDNEDVKQFRGTLDVRLIDGLDNSTIIAYNTDDNLGTQKAAVVLPGSTVGTLIATNYPNLLKLGPYTADIDTNLDHPISRNWAVINTSTYDISDALLLKNIFGYIDSKGISNTSNDVDGTPLPIIDQVTPLHVNENRQTTDELQLQGHNFGDRLSWIVGGLLDYTNEPGGNGMNVFSNDASFGTFDTVWNQNTYRDRAAFGSLTFKLTDALSITAGERHSWYNIALLSIESVAPSPAAFLANVGESPYGTAAAGWGPADTIAKNTSFQGNTYNIGLEEKLNPNVMIYGGYRRGYKPGGFNPKSPPGGLEASFDPETVDDFNIGLKTDFVIAGMHGRFNIEGYWDLYREDQVDYLTAAGGGIAAVTINVPRTTYRGVDLDFSLEPTNWLLLTANYSYIDAYVKSWPDPTFPTSAPGTVNEHLNLAVNPVAFVSPNKFSLTARFHAELGANFGEFVVEPIATYQSRWYVSNNSVLLPQGETSFLGLPYNFNTAAYGGSVVPSYALFNLRMEWNRIMGTRFDAALNGTNLADKTFATGNGDTLPFGVQADPYGPPRMFSIDVSTKF